MPPGDVLSGLALWYHGYWGILAPHFQSFGEGQVLVMIWMWPDARATGRNPWPWLVATLVLGAFGPLASLLTRKAGAKVG